jgi:hypothetical protein
VGFLALEILISILLKPTAMGDGSLCNHTRLAWAFDDFCFLNHPLGFIT